MSALPTNGPNPTANYGFNNLFADILNLGAGYYTQDQAAKAALEGAEAAAGAAQEVGQTAAGMTEFKPFTVTTGTGTVTTTPEGGYSIALTPEQQAMRDRLFSQAGTLFDFAASDPSASQAEIYETIRGIQRPEEERARLALEERMLSQGRLGLRSDAYGGATPEMLARAQAEEQAKLAASLGAREAAMGERKQAFDTASGLFKQTYLPETMALEALGMGTEVGKLADIGRRTGGELFAQLGGRGIESLMQGIQQANTLETAMRTGLLQNVVGGLTGGLIGGSEGSSYQVPTFSIGGFDIGLDDILSGLGGLFSGIGGGTPAPQGEVVVEEIIPTGYDASGNPIYNY
jgi:hypothetical protein